MTTLATSSERGCPMDWLRQDPRKATTEAWLTTTAFNKIAEHKNNELCFHL